MQLPLRALMLDEKSVCLPIYRWQDYSPVVYARFGYYHSQYGYEREKTGSSLA